MPKKNDPTNDPKGHTNANPATSGAAPLPHDFKEKVKQRYEKLAKPEISFEQYLENDTVEFQRQSILAANPALTYKPSIGTITPCGNGDFETGLSPAEWQAAHGTFPSPGGTTTPPGQTIPFSSLTSGIASGALNVATTHQTWVGPGTDPNVPIPTTAPGSAGAVRIGNSINGNGCELLSKTFIVTSAQSSIRFWWAAVFQDPGHDVTHQPFFWVRVTDAAGNIVPGAFDFGNGSDLLVSDNNNPFFQAGKNASGASNGLLYRDWSCAQIDLSSQVGKQVTVEFITGDCGYGGHWGYAYVDNFCGSCKGSPTGDLSYNCEASTHCGPGKICFDYELPKANKQTGTVVIKLAIYQNGTPLTQLTSPTLSSGSTYCFKINPASIPGINSSLGGFDFVATGTFALGTTNLGQIKVGIVPDGITARRNNDYQIACKSCEEIDRDQNAYLAKQCQAKVNMLPRISCHCPPGPKEDKGDCECNCVPLELPDIKPCISVSWGESKCEGIETNDVEVLCVTVCNCYSNITFTDLSIGHITITDRAGKPVPTLPDGTPSIQFIPSGPICFGDIGPCKGKNNPGCISRELVLYTRGAIGKDYRLSFEGICFRVMHHLQTDQCFIVKLCQD